ncbi:hypothetical protein A1O3_06148 [Capronia epimyces CBS 606.96]|uniref:Uncharacterized protein n=1 Tax=Capronia epimyces CBS 606.96 TaxID=1182542 RepID=W9XYB7_9EURO|nr:uncharacterized protein A1O3_06148 [Capronia epimyces CBS 606.96]EXJ82335.1 hypothetical protein A1O3_06148 [Capronia epimyces CBS 606.96]
MTMPDPMHGMPPLYRRPDGHKAGVLGTDNLISPECIDGLDGTHITSSTFSQVSWDPSLGHGGTIYYDSKTKDKQGNRSSPKVAKGSPVGQDCVVGQDGTLGQNCGPYPTYIQSVQGQDGTLHQGNIFGQDNTFNQGNTFGQDAFGQGVIFSQGATVGQDGTFNQENTLTGQNNPLGPSLLYPGCPKGIWTFGPDYPPWEDDSLSKEKGKEKERSPSFDSTLSQGSTLWSGSGTDSTSTLSQASTIYPIGMLGQGQAQGQGQGQDTSTLYPIGMLGQGQGQDTTLWLNSRLYLDTILDGSSTVTNGQESSILGQYYALYQNQNMALGQDSTFGQGSGSGSGSGSASTSTNTNTNTSILYQDAATALGQHNKLHQDNSFNFDQTSTFDQVNTLSQANTFDQGSMLGQHNTFNQGSTFGQDHPFSQGNALGQTSTFDQGNTLGQTNTFNQGNTLLSQDNQVYQDTTLSRSSSYPYPIQQTNTDQTTQPASPQAQAKAQAKAETKDKGKGKGESPRRASASASANASASDSIYATEFDRTPPEVVWQDWPLDNDIRGVGGGACTIQLCRPRGESRALPAIVWFSEGASTSTSTFTSVSTSTSTSTSTFTSTSTSTYRDRDREHDHNIQEPSNRTWHKDQDHKEKKAMLKRACDQRQKMKTKMNEICTRDHERVLLTRMYLTCAAVRITFHPVPGDVFPGSVDEVYEAYDDMVASGHDNGLNGTYVLGGQKRYPSSAVSHVSLSFTNTVHKCPYQLCTRFFAVTVALVLAVLTLLKQWRHARLRHRRAPSIEPASTTGRADTHFARLPGQLGVDQEIEFEEAGQDHTARRDDARPHNTNTTTTTTNTNSNMDMDIDIDIDTDTTASQHRLDVPEAVLRNVSLPPISLSVLRPDAFLDDGQALCNQLKQSRHLVVFRMFPATTAGNNKSKYSECGAMPDRLEDHLVIITKTWFSLDTLLFSGQTSWLAREGKDGADKSPSLLDGIIEHWSVMKPG